MTENITKEVVVHTNKLPATPEDRLQVAVDQRNLLVKMMKTIFVEGVDYGVIPGTKKPTLLLPGAQKLGTVGNVRLKDVATQIDDLGGEHRDYISKVFLETPDGRLAVGIGSCSTKEKKFRYRNSERTCPECGATSIIKGKSFNGKPPEYVCWAKKGGCGMKFKLDDTRITGQQLGKVENPDIADVYNTCYKISKKRAYVDGQITLFAASEFVTQDLEEIPDLVQNDQPVAKPAPTPPPEENKIYVYDFSKADRDKWGAIGIYMLDHGAVRPKDAPTDLLWASKQRLKKVEAYLIETKTVGGTENGS